MDHVYHEQIGPGGHLNLNADANSRAVDVKALEPVEIARNFIRPPTGPDETFIEEFANRGSAVGIRLLFYAEREALNYSSNLVDERLETKPVNTLCCAIIEDFLDDLGHD